MAKLKQNLQNTSRSKIENANVSVPKPFSLSQQKQQIIPINPHRPPQPRPQIILIQAIQTIFPTLLEAPPRPRRKQTPPNQRFLKTNRRPHAQLAIHPRFQHHPTVDPHPHQP